MKRVALFLFCIGCALVSIYAANVWPESAWMCGWVGGCVYYGVLEALRHYRPQWVD